MAVRGASLWATLGIAATTDRSAIRKAYANKLKVTNPEDDPEGFQHLRAAYETALAQAGRSANLSGGTRPTEGVVAPTLVRQTTASERPAVDRERASGPARPAGVSEAELEQLRARFARLQALIDTAPSDPHAIFAAFDASMKAPALDAVVLRAQAERWVASLIVDAAPRADILIDSAVAAFGWANDRVKGRTLWAERVLLRRNQRDLADRLSRRKSLHRVAFRAVRTEPTKLRLLRHWLTPGLADKVQALFRAVDPGDLQTIANDAALAWWRRHLSRRVQWALWALLLIQITAMTVSAFQAGRPLAGASVAIWAVSVISVLAGVGGAWWAAAKGRGWISRHWPTERPFWLRFGWTAPALVGMAMASVASSVFLLPAIVAVQIVALVWATALSLPDRTPALTISYRLYGVIGFDLRLSRSGVAAFCCAPLVLYNGALSFEMSPLRHSFVWLTTIGGIAAFSLGFVDLRRAWLSVRSEATRMALLIGVILLAAATPLGLWATAPGLALVGPAALVVDIVMLAHLVLAPAQTGLQARNLISSMGWLLFVSTGVITKEATAQAGVVLLFGGMWILAIASAGLISALREVSLLGRTAGS